MAEKVTFSTCDLLIAGMHVFQHKLLKAALPEPVGAGVFGWSRSRFIRPGSGSGFKIQTYPVLYISREKKQKMGVNCMSKFKKKAKYSTNLIEKG